MSEKIRLPAVAGVFYPSDPDKLLLAVRGFLDRTEGGIVSPKAIIVPHAGYTYSGVVAATAYAHLQPREITRVVLIGPAHRVMLTGLAVPESTTWETPLGDVPIDLEALEKVSVFPQVSYSERAHLEEHSLEVQLPFLQEVLGDFQLIPLLVGDVSSEEVADVLDALWGGPETLIVVSSDLSHYKPYDEAVKIDQIVALAIANLDVRGLDDDNACGLVPIAGLVHLAQQRGLRAELLDLHNSGDTAGSKDQVVGYGAFAFYE